MLAAIYHYIYVCVFLCVSSGTSSVQHLMTVLISEHQRLFPCEPSPAEESAQAESPVVGERERASLAGWISEEDLQGAPTPTPPASEDTTGSSSSLDICSSGPSHLTPPPNPSTSPGKLPRGGPSWKHPFKGAAGPRPPGDAGGGAGGGASGGGGGGNWLMNGLSSLRGHRRASSGERTRERDTGSAPHHRLSTYDNVSSCSSLPLSAGGSGEGAVHEGGGGASGTSSPWSTSSCEISVSVSPPDPSSEQEPPPPAIDHQGATLSPSGEEGTTGDPEEPHDASVAMETCVSSGEGQAEDMDDSTPSLGNLVGGLKEELRKQKILYEERIQR